MNRLLLTVALLAGTASVAQSARLMPEATRSTDRDDAEIARLLKIDTSHKGLFSAGTALLTVGLLAAPIGGLVYVGSTVFCLASCSSRRESVAVTAGVLGYGGIAAVVSGVILMAVSSKLEHSDRAAVRDALLKAGASESELKRDRIPTKQPSTVQSAPLNQVVSVPLPF